MKSSADVVFELTKREWALLDAVAGAWTIREAARRAGVPYTSARKFILEWKTRARMVFHLDFKAINLLPVFSFVSDLPTKTPPFTFSIRRVLGERPLYLLFSLVPTPFVDKFLKVLGRSLELSVRGYVFLRWFPSSLGTKYNEEKEAVMYDIEGAIITGLSQGPAEEWEVKETAPDKIDLAVIQGRMRDIFVRPGDAVDRAREEDPTVPAVSRQLLSYHVNRHVMPVWRGNSIHFFYESEDSPLMLFLFEGEKAYSAAAALVSMPGFYEAAIDTDKSLVIGQPPYRQLKAVDEIVEKFAVKLRGGTMMLDPKNLVEKEPRLWRYSENNKWVWVE